MRLLGYIVIPGTSNKDIGLTQVPPDYPRDNMRGDGMIEYACLVVPGTSSKAIGTIQLLSYHPWDKYERQWDDPTASYLSQG